MGKSRGKIKNWPEYNRALKQRGSITFWVDTKAIASWYNTQASGKRGRNYRYSDDAITSCLMLKSIFSLSLRGVEGFLNSIFQLMDVDLQAPDYTSVSRRAQTVKVNYRLPSRGPIKHIVIDSTGLKVYGAGEWHVRKHGTSKRRVWRKIHLAVDAATHEIVCGEISLSRVHDAKVFGHLLNPLRRRIKQISGDGAYDTKECYGVARKKGAIATIPPRKNAAMWDKDHPRNDAVEALQKGELEEWKDSTGYHQRSLAETAMYRYKQLIGPKLSLRDYNGQAGEVYAAIKALNKITTLGMPVRAVVC